MLAHVSLADVVWVFVDVPGKAEVTDLDHLIVWEQNISGRQVPVNTLLKGRSENKLLHIFY